MSEQKENGCPTSETSEVGTAASGTPSGPGSDGGLPAPFAAALASAAYLVPFALSRSTAPSPDHPWTLLWYRRLRKPPVTPPDLALPAVWLGIESGLAYAAFRLLRLPGSRTRNQSLALLAANVVGIGAWNRIFFGTRRLPLSTVSAAVLAVSSAAYVVRVSAVDRRAAIASVPLVPWVVFATALTAMIWKRNR